MKARSEPTPLIPVLHLDPDLVIVDKPPGVLSAPGRGRYPVVADLLREQVDLEDNPSLRIVHRLDRDASGVMVLARTLAAQQGLVRQFVHRQVEKVYLAIVVGQVREDGEVNLPLAFDRRKDRACVNSSRGKPSLTRYRVLQPLAGNTLLECRPATGRLHQIRAHLAVIGHPLTVDPLYGGGQSVWLSQLKPGYRASRKREERPLIERLTLHAARISFVHPTTGQPMLAESPPPKDFRATVTQLAKLT